MFANVFTKTTLDRWKPPVIAAVSLAVLMVFGMAVYRGIDVSFWDELPEAFRSTFGIPDGADVGGLAYGAIYSGSRWRRLRSPEELSRLPVRRRTGRSGCCSITR